MFRIDADILINIIYILSILSVFCTIGLTILFKKMYNKNELQHNKLKQMVKDRDQLLIRMQEERNSYKKLLSDLHEYYRKSLGK